jgi:hypothetical protein
MLTFHIAINNQLLILRIFPRNFVSFQFAQKFSRKNISSNSDEKIDENIFGNIFFVQFRRTYFREKFSFKNFPFNENYFTKKISQIFCDKTTKKYFRENFSAKSRFAKFFSVINNYNYFFLIKKTPS